jgi:hypothetical protein
MGLRRWRSGGEGGAAQIASGGGGDRRDCSFATREAGLVAVVHSLRFLARKYLLNYLNGSVKSFLFCPLLNTRTTYYA